MERTKFFSIRETRNTGPGQTRSSSSSHENASSQLNMQRPQTERPHMRDIAVSASLASIGELLVVLSRTSTLSDRGEMEYTGSALLLFGTLGLIKQVWQLHKSEKP